MQQKKFLKDLGECSGDNSLEILTPQLQFHHWQLCSEFLPMSSDVSQGPLFHQMCRIHIGQGLAALLGFPP
jgi:hypothetical protein